MTQATQVALPPGADTENSDDWQAATPTEPAYRCVWTPGAAGPDTDVRGVVVQWGDGTIATEGDDAPLVYINASSYSPDEARTIAEGIRKVADQVDRWAGRFPELDKLVEARAALLEMYDKARRVPDVRTDCLRGSLDSISDLIDAMKRSQGVPVCEAQ